MRGSRYMRDTMTYSAETKTAARLGAKTLGNQIVRWAIKLDFSVIKIAKATGATRQTVYNWMKGGDVTNAYRERAKSLLDILRTSPTAEEAWRKSCARFSLEP